MKYSAAIVVAFLAVGVESFSTAPFRVAPSVSSPKTVPVTYAKRSPTRLFDATAAAVPVPDEPSTSGGTATISNEIFNLVKGIVGAGVLSLPAGMNPLVVEMRTTLSLPIHVAHTFHLRYRSVWQCSISGSTSCRVDCRHWYSQWLWFFPNW